MQVDLTKDDVALIRKLVLREITELGSEIHHTNTSSVRDELKDYRDSLNALSEKLGQ
ncbi:MAG: hypothetical protein H6817_06960 [Phycisphaerales bacterium]|nr:hypothetical protein [Phycisphaerales bacterium]